METSLTQPSSQTGRLYRRRLLPALLLALLCIGGFSSKAQFLLQESFDGTTFPPTNWTRTNGAGNSNPIYSYIGWERTTSAGTTGQNPIINTHSGAGMAWFGAYWIYAGGWSELKSPVIDLSTYSGTKVVSFWTYCTNYTYNDSLRIYVNTSATSSGGTLIAALQPTRTTPTGWTQYSFNIPASYSGTTNYIIFRAFSQYGSADIFLDDVSVFNLGPCTGPVSAGTLSPAGTTTVCPGATPQVASTGYGIASSTTQYWEYSLNGGTTWITLPGATGATMTSFPITVATKYRFVNVCNITGDTSRSTPNTFNPSSSAFPKYASLPFFESFESWTNGCGTNDLPSINWTASPTTGDASFRRYDQGASGNWNASYLTSGTFSPQAALGTYSARWHGYYAPTGTPGQLSCYVDCSAITGTKELQYYVRTYPGSSYPFDSVIVEYSMDAGMTWNLIRKLGGGTGGWDYYTYQLASNSATTVIRWTYKDNYQYYGDMGLDGVRILPPCNGKPTAGTIDSVTACQGKNFTLTTTGTSNTAGLIYTWQYKPTGSLVGWSNLPGGNVPKPTANISVPTSFRVIVTCSNTTPTVDDTSAVVNVTLAPFYYCYCNYPTAISYPQYGYNGIGNVSVSTRPANVVLMNNPSGLNYPYISYARTVAPPTVIRDSTYRFSMTDIAGSYSYTYPIPSAFFLDWNRNGVWDLPGERIMNKTTATLGAIAFQDYQIPTNAGTGLTGLRAIHGYNITTPVDPCGSLYYLGECEDYLVYIEYQPCNGPVNPGTAHISDTVVCPGYTVDLWDTSYEKQRTGVVRGWEVSTNLGASYSIIPGSLNKDTMFNVVVPASSYGVRYRLRARCSNTGDTTYSNWLSVTNPDPNSCYPFASATPPGTKDSSDIGSFVIGSFVNPQPMVVSGPHLSNPAANRRRTDYTRINNITLAADSTYRIAIYHTMRSVVHADALISVFIDFNHDGLYSEASPGYPYPSELIYRGKTDAVNFYLDTMFKMPSTLIRGATGMRVVLNNDVNPGNPGNLNGTGSFTSGEVEDYIVNLTRDNLGVINNSTIQNLAVFPNPTDAKATVVFDAPKAVAHLEMTVTTITGQRVMSRSFDNVGKHFTAEVDLTGKAKGIYFVELRADDGQKVSRKLVVQ